MNLSISEFYLSQQIKLIERATLTPQKEFFYSKFNPKKAQSIELKIRSQFLPENIEYTCT